MPKSQFMYIVIILMIASSVFFSFLPKSLDKQKTDSNSSIKLGLLVSSDTAKDPLCKQAVDVVNLVINDLNTSGGINGKRVDLSLRACDGKWGAGSKQAVSLIYEEGANALIGFVDGRTAHLIEQVCTKAQIPFMSTYSPDPTLSKINIPWFFSSIPNAEQQAAILSREIFQNQGLENVVVVASDDYDAGHLLKSFSELVKKDRAFSPKTVRYQSENVDFKSLASELSESKTDGVVFFGNSKEYDDFIYYCNLAKVSYSLFCPVMELEETIVNNSSLALFRIEPINWDKHMGIAFRKRFRDTYHYTPGKSAAYVYDGINLVIEAIQNSGSSPDAIREGLVDLEWEGLSGKLSFNASGSINSQLLISKDVSH